jgi:hypothetical protein
MKFFAAMLALAALSCETSERFDTCVHDNKRVLICKTTPNGDRVSSSIVSGRRHEYPDAPDGICEDEAGAKAFEVGHKVVLVYGAAPLVWGICGLEPYLGADAE